MKGAAAITIIKVMHNDLVIWYTHDTSVALQENTLGRSLENQNLQTPDKQDQ